VGSKCGDDVHQFIRVALVDLQIEHVDPGKFLEQGGFAFHHRFARQRADVRPAPAPRCRW
jgi:hypothetical protein